MHWYGFMGIDKDKLLWQGNLVGVSYEPAKSNIPVVHENTEDEDVSIFLKFDAYNPFDSYAIKVFANDYFVGFIPKEVNRMLFNQGMSNLNARFVQWNQYKDTAVGLCVEVRKKRSIFGRRKLILE